MRLSLRKTGENLIWLLTVFILTTYLVFETYTWGRYAFFGASVAIVLLAAALNKGRFTVRLDPYHYFMLLFIGFTAMSSLWALKPSDAISKAVTLTLILGCNMMLYVYYQREADIEKLLNAVMWAGYVVAIYAFVFYGFDRIMAAAGGKRINNAFTNVNTIGLAAAVSCIIQVHQWLYKQNRKSVIFMIPCIIVVAASQSRKAFVLLLLGVFAAYLFKNRRSSDLANKLAKMALLLFAALGLVILIYALPFFAGVRERMDSMFAGIFGVGEADHSTLERMAMIDLGITWFLRYPIGGIGMGNPHFLAARYLGNDTYLHNNFVELLCGGGIIGFVVYYSMYVYLFRNLWKYRHADRKHFEICFVWLILMFIMDYGMVSYYSKAQWFYLMVHFLNVSCMKKKSSVMKYATQKTDTCGG